MDVKYQLVLSVHLWPAVRLQLSAGERQRYVGTQQGPPQSRRLTNFAAANQMAQQMQMGAQQPNMFGPGVDPDKQFKAEAENLADIEHYSVLDDVEERLLEGIKS